MVVRLKSLRYWERVGRPREWTLEGLTLGAVNLLVGTNATGKTRAINVLWNFARFFLPEPKYRSANAGYDLVFDAPDGELRYVLDIAEGKIRQEEVHLAGRRLLVRRADGVGEIFTQEEGRSMRFRPPDNELAAVVRRDSLQHAFLEPLHEWALAVRHYTFGRGMGRDVVVLAGKAEPGANERDQNQVVALFRRAEKELGPAFTDAVLGDMARLHYHVEAVEAHASGEIKVLHDGVPSDVLVLAVKERGVEGFIDQGQLSQGMFRVLSVLVQLNYCVMAGRASCVLIDDIGEGLDFGRSARLIELLVRKAAAGSLQLVMTTNDQFVMNHVPLENWSVLVREGGRVRVRNYDNAREIFEEFKFIGVSNFSFLEMGFADDPPVAPGAGRGGDGGATHE
jgi:hypothetical protein